MNKEWSNLQKEVMLLLKKKDTFNEGINKLVDFRTMLFNEWYNAMHNLSKENYTKQPFINKPGYESKTIGYSIYHVFRIEDIVLNTLINKKEQIFFKDDYKNKMNSKIITTGNELVKEEIGEFSKWLDIYYLWEYARSVYEETNKWLLSINYNDLKIVYSKLDEDRIKYTETVNEKEYWLIEYWCGKNILGLIGMPFSRHWIAHLEASLRIKNKI